MATANFPAIPAKAMSLGCEVKERQTDEGNVTAYVKRLRNPGAGPSNVEVCRVVQKGDDVTVYLSVLVPADEDTVSWGFQRVRGEGRLVSGDLSSGEMVFVNTVPGTAYEAGDKVRFARASEDDLLPTVGA